jgi:hypothetical protein
MNMNTQQIATHARSRKRMLRRLGWTLCFSIVRGIGYISGTALATALIWWLTSR